MIIPPHTLEADTLRAIIEEFVMSEGTEYGARDYTLEEKVTHVQRQIEAGDVVIIWSESNQTIGLFTKQSLSINSDTQP